MGGFFLQEKIFQIFLFSERPPMKKNNRKTRAAAFSALAAAFALTVLLIFEQFGIISQTVQPLSSEEAQLVQSFREADLSVCVFNIGQADSILVKQGEAVMLIDCGEADDAGQILENLEKLGVSRIDTLVLTHPHADHIGGAQEILESVSVGTIYMPAVSASTVTFERLMDCILENEIDAAAASAGMEIPLGGCSLHVLSPAQDFYSDNLNEYSIVLLLEYNGIKMLFTGDAEQENEDMILTSGENIDCDFVKIGHHGSATSSTQAFIDACSADWAVATTQYNSPHGLPKEEILTRWKDSGAAVLCTHQYGDIYAFVLDGSFAVFTSQQPVSNS